MSTALLLPGAYDGAGACTPDAAPLLLLFAQLLGGLLLPLYAAYAGELAAKVVFVRRWARAQGLGVREAAHERAREARGGRGGDRGDVGSGGSGQGSDGDASSRSGASWPSSRSGASDGSGAGCVTLALRGRFAPIELAAVSDGPPVAAHAHVAWGLVLAAVAWGVTTQARGVFGRGLV